MNLHPPDGQDSSPLEDILKSIDAELSMEDLNSSKRLSQLQKDKSLHPTNTTFYLANSLKILINDNYTKATLRYDASAPPPRIPLKTAFIIKKLNENSITHGIIETNIQQAMSIIEEDPKSDLDAIIAIGREPQEGVSAKMVDWIGDVSPNPEINDDGQIYVRKNDVLFKLKPMKKGIPGLRIDGVAIPPQPVETLAIIAGKNVLCTKEREFIATCEGHILYEDDCISVISIDSDAEACIIISEDKMQATLSFTPAQGRGSDIRTRDVLSLLEEMTISTGIDKACISRCLKQAKKANESIADIVIAQGTHPQQGQDAHIVWHVNPKESRTRYIIESSGSIDFHNLSDIFVVEEDTLLLTHYPNTQGKSGFNVHGEETKGFWGNQVHLIAGLNLTKSDDQTKWYAGCPGRFTFMNSTVSVNPVLLIEGDVDFSCGNITFDGDVVIKGNILDGFEVKATGNISVAGSIEAAFVFSEKCIEVKKGIFGKEKGMVTAEEDIISSFLQNAQVKAHRDVIASNQILNSKVYAGNSVQVTHGKGSLVGGSTMAGHFIEAKVIGTQYGTKTTLDVGTDFYTLEQMLAINEKRTKLQQQLKKLNDVLEREEAIALTPSDFDLITAAQEKKMIVENAIHQLKHDYQEAAHSLNPTPTPSIDTSIGIMPEVSVRMQDRKYRFTHPVERAYVTFDPKLDRIKLTTRS